MVTVVIPTYRRADRLDRLLDALDRQSLGTDNFEVIVVDDCSGDDTGARLAARVPTVGYRLRPMRTDENGGPAVARNLGWRAAAAPLLAFIDDDCVPQVGWLEAGVEALQTDPRLGVVQGRTQLTAGVDLGRFRGLVDFRIVDGPTPHFEGCNIFYRREALASTDGFAEEIGWWGEDTAAGWRVLDAGWGRGFAAAAVAEHDVEVRPFRTFLRNSYLEQNIVRLAADHPAFRREYFWRSWAVTPGDATFVLAVVTMVGALRWRPLLAGVAPYVWLRRPSRRDPRPIRSMLTTAALDAARTAGHVVGAIRHRVLVI